MAAITSFPPIARRDSVVLILGSMPGRESLARQQYYAHPRNAFWPIMGELFGAGPEIEYPLRKKILCEQRIAVWDVLRECVRSGSLDSAIHLKTEVPNDFRSFFQRHKNVRTIFFNGRKAEAAFERHVRPVLQRFLNGIQQIALPSTSPAYASVSWGKKLSCWRNVVDHLSYEQGFR
ncbi:MAG: DNA-deoxyinosine glycosylase [Pirellulales bacterium]|nr:DNA-deoxyinosine glycosylase [Pirellulales bacterium]